MIIIAEIMFELMAVIILFFIIIGHLHNHFIFINYMVIIIKSINFIKL